jgi:hypothetical protein
MLSALRSRLTYANVVATFALVFGMTGGALAAKHYLITSTKQISPKVLKELKSKQGAAGATGKEGALGKTGATGATGAAGGNGESVAVSEVKPNEAACNKLGGAKFAVGGKEAFACDGKAGSSGTEGQPGESVVDTPIAPSSSNAECKEGGAEFKVGKGSPTFACNGKEGSPWTDGGRLPANATETGVWSFQASAAGIVHVPISFPIPLATTLEITNCGKNEENPGCHAHFVKSGETGTGDCEGGTVEEPKAKPGYLCIYGRLDNANEEVFAYFTPALGLDGRFSTVGGIFGVVVEAEPGEGSGTWAVTAE